MSNLVPLNVLSAVTILDNQLEGWTLLDVPASEPRSFALEVKFERPFAGTPLVQIGIVGWDIGNQDASRLRVRAQDVRPDGFWIHLETWLNTRVWSVEVSWLAIGSAH